MQEYTKELLTERLNYLKSEFCEIEGEILRIKKSLNNLEVHKEDVTKNILGIQKDLSINPQE